MYRMKPCFLREARELDSARLAPDLTVHKSVLETPDLPILGALFCYGLLALLTFLPAYGAPDLPDLKTTDTPMLKFADLIALRATNWSWTVVSTYDLSALGTPDLL